MQQVADNPIRKAAVLMRSLEPQAAAAMLGRLSADEARALRSAIQELGEIEDAERHAVADQLRSQPAHEPSASSDGSVELAISTPHTNQAAAESYTPPQPSQVFQGRAWLATLEDAEAGAVAAYLAEQPAAAIALVIGSLPASTAASVLQQMPADQRAQSVARLAEQGEPDAPSVEVVARGLHDHLEAIQERRRQRTTRAETIRQILAATPEQDRQHLLAGLADFEPGVAAELGFQATKPLPPQEETAPSVAPLAFEQLEKATGKTLWAALAELDNRTASLALAGASEALLGRLTSGMPRATAREFRARLLRIAPATLAEIDKAQLAFGLATALILQQQTAATEEI